MCPAVVYMDNHATTRVDRRVIQAMLPLLETQYGNAGSSHALGWEAKDAIERARQSIAAVIGASAREVIFTSGATESNNLARARRCRTGAPQGEPHHQRGHRASCRFGPA